MGNFVALLDRYVYIHPVTKRDAPSHSSVGQYNCMSGVRQHVTLSKQKMEAFSGVVVHIQTTLRFSFLLDVPLTDTAYLYYAVTAVTASGAVSVDMHESLSTPSADLRHY